MKRIIYILGIIACAIVCVSCDTRDDWFKENCEEVYFYFVFPDGRTDTVDVKKPHMLEYTMRVNAVDDMIRLKTIEFQAYCETSGQKQIVRPESLSPTGKPDCSDAHVGGFTIRMEYIFNRDYYTSFSGWGDSTNIQLFDSDTTARKLGSETYIVKYYDAFYNEHAITMKINLIGNIPPIPVIEVSGEGMERTISLKESYDKDGSVSKYEVCIDGNIVEYNKNDNRYEKFGSQWGKHDDLLTPDQYWQGGKAAYGGVYITSTSINVFNHIFQEPGKHIVYYRCMDNEETWSTWKEKTIEISE